IVAWGDGTAAGSRVRPGVVCDETINLLDFMRTFAALTGAALAEDEAVDSYNMLPALFGDGDDQRIREAQFSTSMNGAFAIAQKDDGNEWKLPFTSGSGGFTPPAGQRHDPAKPISDHSQYH